MQHKKQIPETLVSLELTMAEIEKYAKTSYEIEYLLGSAGDVFSLRHEAFCQGFFEPDNRGIISLLEMVRRGFVAATEKEGVVISQLSQRLREGIEQGETA